MSRLLIVLAFLGTFATSAACGQRASDGRAYVASSRGEVYYWVECDAWRSISPSNLRWFESAAEAEAAGYIPSGARGCAGPDARQGPTPIVTGTCTIARVVDGDTVSCLEAAERIRLLLIDAPELSQGEYGERAREYLEQLVPVGSSARVEIDIQERDPYGRILAYLYTPEGSMINQAMVASGYAIPVVYPPNVRYIDLIRATSVEARLHRRGLWSEDAFECSPAEARSGNCQ